MDKRVYFNLMKETSDIADNLILNLISSQFKGPLYDLVVELPKKRTDSTKPKSRPAIFRFSYELAGGKDWQKYKNVAAALEMLNISTYSLNYVLDDKGGEKPKQQRNNECMASMIQRELAQELLRKIEAEILLQDYLKIDKRFSEINKVTSGIGQYLDGNRLREIEQKHIETYLERCEALTGIFMKCIAEIGAILAGATDEQIKLMGEFGRNYGIIIQIVNDLGDYLPHKSGRQSVAKVYQDQYSDLRHGCITFPAYHILLKGNKEEIEAVNEVKQNLNASEESCLAVTHSFIRLEGIKEVKKLVFTYAKQAKQAIHKFDRCQARDFLSTAISMHRSNKFYGTYRAIKNQPLQF